ncbi:hypothetical protein [Streptomyces griseoluteus]|uniref:hypothetical protein n=1 Tax=Streptomyces griseoluteus TaxID=29306 RepID=UPI003570B981
MHPDGSTTGPYQPWQVIGLVLTLLVPVCWGALRCDARSVVVGTPVGLTVAAFYDWSDDPAGLFGVGVTLVLLGSVAATGTVTAPGPGPRALRDRLPRTRGDGPRAWWGVDVTRYVNWLTDLSGSDS